MIWFDRSIDRNEYVGSGRKGAWRTGGYVGSGDDSLMTFWLDLLNNALKSD